MSTNPFHGIFGTLSQGAAPSTTPPLVHTWGKQERAPTPPHEKQLGQVAVDIFEQENYYIIKAPLAGVHLSDLDIEISDNVITIRGVRRQCDDAPQNQYYVQECFWGEFRRNITLPCTIDSRRVRATFNRDCVLKLIIPKEEKVKIVRISEG